MSVTAAELIAYGSANMPIDDSSTYGGAIDTTNKVLFTDIASTGTVTVVSSAAGDTTQTVTVTGRLASGVIDTDIISLNGTTPVAGAKNFERILKVLVSASHTGTITVTKTSGGATIGTLESGILILQRLFYNAFAEASGGSTKNYYEKIFLKNTNATLALLGAAVVESADPSGLLTFTLENAQGGTTSKSNRLTVPASGETSNSATFDGASKAVPGTDIAAGAAIGVWVKLTLVAGAASAKSTYSLTLSGTSV